MNDPAKGVARLRQRIQDGDREVSDRDADTLMSFSNQLQLLASQYSDHRHLKLLRHCTRMAENVDGIDLTDCLESRDATEAVVRWINRTYDNEETNRDYRSALRVFGKRVTRSDEPPESISWVPTSTSTNYDPMPRESDMLDWDPDVEELLDGCRNPRDAACIAVQFEAGLRGGELYNLDVGDIVDSEHALALEVEGKTGRRAVHLIISVPYLQRWLDAHPAGDDRDAPLWTTLSASERQSYKGFLQNFKNPAKRVGLEKPVTPTNFRKSNARWLIRQGMSQARIEDRHGRKRGSEQTARYVSRFGKESSEIAYAQLHGEDVEDTSEEELAPVSCPRCGQKTPADRDYCMHCRQSLDLESKGLLDSVKERLDERLITADSADERAQWIRARRAFERDPNVLSREELHDLVTSLDSASAESID